MRIWDISPGYLSRQSLIGEHREVLALVSILVHGQSGDSRDPETLRWMGYVPALRRRHAMLAAEMCLRGYADLTPWERDPVGWPDGFVTPPAEQLAILRATYQEGARGRIPLPATAQELWAHHKYSVMARDQALYRTTGRRVSSLRRGSSLAPLAGDLVQILRREPPGPALINAIDHIWGHVSKAATADERARARASPDERFRMSRSIAIRTSEPYLLASTALGELAMFTQCG